MEIVGCSKLDNLRDRQIFIEKDLCVKMFTLFFALKYLQRKLLLTLWTGQSSHSCPRERTPCCSWKQSLSASELLNSKRIKMVSTIKKKRAAVECNKNTSELLNNKKRQDAQQNKKRKSTSASSSPACRRRLLSSSEGRETGTVVQILSFGFGLVKCQRISITLFGF